METKLIELYCTICQCNDSRFRDELQRLSNNNCPQFSDEELITVFLWGKEQQLLTRRAIYDFTKGNYQEWFPKLPSYQAFCRRLNRIAGAFRALAEIWMEEKQRELDQQQEEQPHNYAVDSCPLMLACRSNSTGAKVAREVCNKSFNATRQEWYYGVKLHAFVRLRPGRLPIPCALNTSKASLCDLWAAKQIVQDCGPIYGGNLFADKAYIDASWAETMKNELMIHVVTPKKNLPGDVLRSRNCFNTYVSQNRQPIECFFNWLQVKTGIQSASRVRSLSGLFFHIFSALAFASLLLKSY